MKLTASLSWLCIGLLFTPLTFAQQALSGQWVRDEQGQTMLDPQPSGLTWWHDELLMLGDQSAEPSMRMKLFRLDPNTSAYKTAPVNIEVSAEVRAGCFGDYLINSPDLEALTWDRIDDTTLITVTEDASRAQLSPTCSKKFAQTNSTAYPTLLLKISTDKSLSKAIITAVRPVQFPIEAQVGNLPNDGIEGLAIDDHQNLYLALEKNMAADPAIFKTRLTPDFWAKDNFVKVIDANLTLPPIDKNGHPINDLEFMPSTVPGHPGYLIAVARNDDQLWIFDLTNRVQPYVEQLSFYVPTDNSGLCPVYERMVQTALEGVTIHNGKIFLINDPWKQHYLDNIQCDTNAENFRRNSPLMFNMNVDPRWFDLARPKKQTSLPGISAMLQIEPNRYLIVQDKKISNAGDRLGLLHVKENTSPVYQSVFTANWPDNQAANDLEAACAIPGRPNEYLLAESGTWHGEFGRLIHIRLMANYATVLAHYPMPVENDNTEQQVGDNFEGLVCVNSAPNRYLLVLAERGGEGKAGTLQTGELDLAAAEVRWHADKTPVNAPKMRLAPANQRDIADLYLQDQTLWAVAVQESGELGPFASVIYPVATLDLTKATPLEILAAPLAHWVLDGEKVEALASAPPVMPSSALAVGSENELLNGSWHVLASPLQQATTSPVEAANSVEASAVDTAPVTTSVKTDIAKPLEATQQATAVAKPAMTPATTPASTPLTATAQTTEVPAGTEPSGIKPSGTEPSGTAVQQPAVDSAKPIE
ncbi:MAG: hypothetical protein J0M22_14570 [Gammaproteobacteria bacterium]|nr:hypothetical protein [Gammaproteobacteria bacterium]